MSQPYCGSRPVFILLGLAALISVTAGAEEPARWWAFQPIRNPAIPDSDDHDWTLSPIDGFISSELHSHGLRPAPTADRRTWIRRVALDLTGLPPSPAEVAAFLRDESPAAHGRVVDRLLASPNLGTRWARHWLDVARYADYHNGEASERSANCEPMEAWRYRDWVVRSFNRDLSFERFCYLQIAGDLVPHPEGDSVHPDGLIATTFLSNGVWDRDDADKEKIVSDMVDDQIDTVGKAFMGLTLGCARCHDHKFDPVTRDDYYALAGIFYSTHIVKELGTKGGQYTLNRRPLVSQSYLDERDEQQRQLNEIEQRLTDSEAQLSTAQSDLERGQLIQTREDLRRRLLPAPPMADAVQEGGTPGGLFPNIQDVPIHIRGSYRRLGALVPRRLPIFFAGATQQPIEEGSGRRQLADWVVGRDNPLTARVIANRIWLGHFKTGLVRTPNNFGRRAIPPSHPALLDWLATLLVENDWSLKRLHRSIVLSATYRQTSHVVRDTVARDPTNRWLARFPAHRLDAEVIRDAMLTIAGQLDSTVGGPAFVDLSIPRRSLYLQTARWDHNTYATLFDAANSDVSTGTRNTSTVAPQSLFLLNSQFSHQLARSFAERIELHDPHDVAAKIEFAYQAAYSRPPSEKEIVIVRQLLATMTEMNQLEAWTEVAHVLLCSNELVYVD